MRLLREHALLIAAFVVATTSAATPVGVLTAAPAPADIEFLLSNTPVPLLRWWDALILHQQLGGPDIIGNANASTSAATVQWFMFAGSVPWFVVAMLVGLVDGVDPLQLAGRAIDDAMRGVLSVFFAPDGSGVSPAMWLVIAALILAVSVGIMRSRGQSLRALVPKLVSFLAIVGLLAFSSAQLMSRQGDGGGRGDGDYDAPFGTPGWVVSTIDDTFDVLSAVPAASLAGATSLGGASPTGDDPSIYDCAAFVRQMQAEAGVDGSALGAVSTMWGTAALQTYNSIAFSDASTLGDQVYCRMLDRQSSVATGNTFAIDAELLVEAGLVKSSVFDAPDDASLSGSNLLRYSTITPNDVWTSVMVGWAMCDRTSSGWDFNDRYSGFRDEDDSTTLDARCADLMTATWDDGEPQGLEDRGFWAVDSASIAAIVDGVSDDMARHELTQYLRGLTGASPNASSAFLFAVASPVGAVPMIGVGAVVLVLKFAVLAFMATMWASLFAALFRVDAPFRTVIWPPLARLIGATILASGAALILSILALFGTAISSLFSMNGAGTSWSVIGAAMAPGLALFALHFAFKRANLPSPVTLGGARAWSKGGPLIAGAAAGAVGGALGATAVGMAKNAGSAGMRKLAGAGLERAGLGSVAGVLGLAGTGKGVRGGMGGGRGGPGGTASREDFAVSRAAAEKALGGREAETLAAAKAEQRAQRTSDLQDRLAGAVGARGAAQHERAEVRAERQEARAATRTEVSRRRAEFIARHHASTGTKGVSTVLAMRASLAARGSMAGERITADLHQAGAAARRGLDTIAASSATGMELIRGGGQASLDRTNELLHTMQDPELRKAMFGDAARVSRAGAMITADAIKHTSAAETAARMARDPKAWAGAALTATGIGAGAGVPLLAAASVQAHRGRIRDAKVSEAALVAEYQRRQTEAAVAAQQVDAGAPGVGSGGPRSEE